MIKKVEVLTFFSFVSTSISFLSVSKVSSSNRGSSSSRPKATAIPKLSRPKPSAPRQFSPTPAQRPTKDSKNKGAPGALSRSRSRTPVEHDREEP